ncbi:uncharacterized protein FYN12_001999 [Phoenicopterus ruber ruber]
MAERLKHHQQHAACWMETELLQQQLKASQEKTGWAEEMEAEWRWLTQECQELWLSRSCRQLVRTQEEHERLLQAAVEQAEGLEHNLRSAEAVLAEKAAQLKDTQAQLSRNKLLIEDLHEENRGFAMACRQLC